MSPLYYCVGIDGDINEDEKYYSVEDAKLIASSLYSREGCAEKISVYRYDNTPKARTTFWEQERMDIFGRWRESWL